MDALEGAVRAAEPCAILLPAWQFEKLVAADRGTKGAIFSVAKVGAQIVERQRLLELAEREELPVAGGVPSCANVILLARPEADVLSSEAGPEILRRYWRLLFRARVKEALLGAIRGAENPRAAVQARVERIGRAVFNEARFVLQRERYIGWSADDAEAYAEFGAVYLELTRFAPEPLKAFFPAVDDAAAVLGALAEDVDADALFKSTRPAGAADPQDGSIAGATDDAPAASPKRRRRDAKHVEKLLSRAADADAVGNDVRGALFRMRVYRASRENTASVYSDALKDLDQLVARLKAALELDEAVARQWRAWLVALLDNAAVGWWNAEGRLLYDLQKVCVYHEREIYSVNVVDHLLQFGRRPLKRPQPGQRQVLIIKALRSALRRTARARLSPRGRSELRRLIQQATDAAEERLRAFLRPAVTASLDDGGLRPQTPVEAVAHQKLVEELVEGIAARGYLTFGELRDAVSRNQMKLDDLQRVQDFTRGDQLLRIDEAMESRLDYVYHRGEIYLRGFHRLSSVFFATQAGRLLTKMVILPLGGAYVILEALDHSVGLLIHKLAARQHVVRAAAASAAQAFGPTAPVVGKTPEPPPIFTQWWLLLLLGVFLFGLVNSPKVRSIAARAFKQLFRGLRAVFVDAPRWIARRPLVRAVLGSRFARSLIRYGVKPLLLAGVAYLLLPYDVTDRTRLITVAGAFLGLNLLLNSRYGRAMEQAVLHAMRTSLARLTWDILAGIVRQIVQVFEAFLEWIDRLLYAVDELLRFRAGQARGTVVVKAVLGVFWFYIAYITRFAINLLVEPQINPIKHFPVVTVSHKMLFPTIPLLASVFQTFRIDRAVALTYATAVIWCIPGIFGFLAWEFKENWKLYRANRARTLKPVRVGSHGETIAQFLRPGFHSGTVPKIFHRLRKAQLRSNAPLLPTNKHVEAMHHVEEALVAFANREFVALLNQDPLYREAPIALGHVRLAATTIRMEFLLQGQEAPLVVTFEQRAGWIIAAVEEPGWAATRAPAQWQLLSAALLGLYKIAGADVVHEQVASLFPEGTRFDFRRDELIVWPTADFAVEARYGLTVPDEIAPVVTGGGDGTQLPAIRAEQVLFNRVWVDRDAWVALWWRGRGIENGGAERGVLEYASPRTPEPGAPLPRVHVLPEPSAGVAVAMASS
jgi:hypothetical protein